MCEAVLSGIVILACQLCFQVRFSSAGREPEFTATDWSGFTSGAGKSVCTSAVGGTTAVGEGPTLANSIGAVGAVAAGKKPNERPTAG